AAEKRIVATRYKQAAKKGLHTRTILRSYLLVILFLPEAGLLVEFRSNTVGITRSHSPSRKPARDPSLQKLLIKKHLQVKLQVLI
ncbi:MAG: hypothetical protein ACFCUM_13180, partial [Bacteroidales bacterium]